MANNSEYRDYNSSYSARSENMNTSIRDSKRNRFVLDNNMNWYVFENEIQMGLDFLDKYRNSLLQISMKVNISKDYYMRPEYVSYQLYGTTDLWYILLYLNDMKNPNEFIKPTILAIDTSQMSVLQKILDQGRKWVNNSVNPKYINKHYLKHPKLPSEKLLPDKYDEKIYDCGFVKYANSPFIENLEYIHNYSDYYHGKVKMTEIKENTITRQYTELSNRYMDGIMISNNTTDPIYDISGEAKEYKFTGYMYFPYAGEYEFQFNGINGEAYLNIDGEYCVNRNNEYNISLPNIDKKFDFFELKTKNSDFKKRNWSGWTYHDSTMRLVTDPNKRKPVGKIKVDDNFFEIKYIEASKHIVDTVGNDIVDKDQNYLNYIADLTGNDNSDELGLIFYNKLTAEDIDITLEPFSDGKSGKLIFCCEMLANNVENLEIQPYIQIRYTDSTIDKSILSHYNVGSLWTTNEYDTLNVTINIDSSRTVSSIEFGILCEKHNVYEPCSAEIMVNEVSINMTEFESVVYQIPMEKKDTWMPFVCSYKFDGSPLKMFSIRRRIDVSIDGELNYIVDKKNDNIIDLTGGKIKYHKINYQSGEMLILPNRQFVADKLGDFFELKTGVDINVVDGTVSFVGEFHNVRGDIVAIVPPNNLSTMPESVLITISNNYIREACYLQHNINEPVDVISGKNSTISYKTCLVVENNNSKYKLQLEQSENVEIYIDNMAIPAVKDNGTTFYFSPVSNEANNNEIRLNGYRLANLEIYVKNTENSTISANLSISERNAFQDITDDYFVVKPNNLFKFEEVTNPSEQFNYSNKNDVIGIESNNRYKYLNVFKPSIINITELTNDRTCNNFVIDFYVRINSEQKGLFIINLDEQAEGSKYSLILNCNNPYTSNPEFNVQNGLYVNTGNSPKLLANIDVGIDFYNHKYEEIKPYKNMIDSSNPYYLRRFVLEKNNRYYFKIKKKKNYISLQIDGMYIAIWHDYDHAYSNGICGFTFVNVNNAEITELNLNC